MSDETRAALETALEAHVKDEHDEDDILTGYVIQICASNLERPESNWYTRYIPAYQPYHSSVGLVELLGRTYAVEDEDDD